MVKYSIPFNGDLGLVKDAFKTAMVGEVYFAGTGRNDTGNHWSGARSRAISGKTLGTLLRLCRRHGVKSNLLCNSATLFFSDLSRTFDYIRSLGHVDAITVADPFAVSAFVKEFPDKDIQASIIMNLDSSHKVEKVLGLGLGTVNVPGRFNRDISGLKSLSRLKAFYPNFKIKLLANYDCFFDCPFSTWHYMLGTYKSVFGDWESLVRRNRVYPCADECAFDSGPVEWIKKPFIRPEDVEYYERNNCADIFKLVFRSDRSEVLKQVYDAYFSGRFDGDLFEIVNTHGTSGIYCDNTKFPPDFVKFVTTCNKECIGCDYCQKVAGSVAGNRLNADLSKKI